MGVVYLGRDPGMERQVAVKTVKTGADEDSKNRLRIEGRAGKLDHENIVTVFETGQWNDNLPYIAMEFILGDPLDKLATSDRQLTLIEKLDVIRQVCEGLDYAHLNGVLHRDIKPANIIRRRDGRVKIVDFGIAKVASSLTVTSLTAPLQVIGTLGYMAPERLQGSPRLDGRVDIWATGVLLYFLLTGEEPFTGEFQAVMHKIVNEPYPPLNLRLAGYPFLLDQILDRALAKDPDDRYSTAQEFSADLAAVIDELNRGRIAGMLEDCQRLIEQSLYQPATEKARQVLKIDPQNSTGRELLSKAQRGLANLVNEERLNNLIAEARASGSRKTPTSRRFRRLRRLFVRKPADQNLQTYLETVREKWRVQTLKDSLFNDAVIAEKSGDLTGAIHRLREAIKLDPDNVQALEKAAQLEKEVREQEERSRAERHIANAKQKLSARRYTEAIALLEELRVSRISHPDLDPLLSEALSAQQQQDIERRRETFFDPGAEASGSRGVCGGSG